MVLPLPMIKLGGLIVRTLTKPLAKEVKTRSKVDPQLHRLCNGLGQWQHRLLIRFHMGYRGVANYVIKDLPVDQAVEKGADLIGERSAVKSKEKERVEVERKLALEADTERRFEELEEKVIWLEAQLAVMGRIVERDMNNRIEEADEQEEAKTTVLTPKRKGSDATESVDSESSSSSSSLWGSITGLFR